MSKKFENLFFISQTLISFDMLGKVGTMSASVSTAITSFAQKTGCHHTITVFKVKIFPFL